MGRSRQAVAPQASTTASKSGLQFLRGHVGSDIHSGTELGPLGLHLGQATFDMALLHLELGDPVAQQAPDAVGPLEHHHPVAGPGQLLGRGQPGRPRPHHGHAVAGADRGRLGHDPALGPGPVHDLYLDLLDRHRRLVDAQHAGRLARRGAQSAGELWEVVGGVQALDGPAPMPAGTRGRSSPGSGCPGGSRCCRTGCRSPCSATPAGGAGPRGIPRTPLASP